MTDETGRLRYEARAPHHRPRWLVWIVALYFIVGTLALTAAFVGGWLSAGGGTVRFTLFEPDAEDLLTELVDESRLRLAPVGRVERMYADGATPDAAKRRYSSPHTLHEIASALKRACRAEGLGVPDPSILGSMPNALCEGEWRGGSVTVTIDLLCARTCRADIDVYHFWF